MLPVSYLPKVCHLLHQDALRTGEVFLSSPGLIAHMDSDLSVALHHCPWQFLFLGHFSGQPWVGVLSHLHVSQSWSGQCWQWKESCSCPCWITFWTLVLGLSITNLNDLMDWWCAPCKASCPWLNKAAESQAILLAWQIVAGCWEQLPWDNLIRSIWSEANLLHFGFATVYLQMCSCFHQGNSAHGCSLWSHTIQCFWIKISFRLLLLVIMTIGYLQLQFSVSW